MMFFLSFFLSLLIATPLVAKREVQYNNQTLQPLVMTLPSFQGFLPVPFWESMAWKRGKTGKRFLTNSDLKIAEENFNNFCSKIRALPRPDYSIPPENCSIPPVIHFIWLGSPISESVETVMESWRKYHPGWEINAWTDAQIPGFSWSNTRLQTAFVQADTWAEKADILRLEILFQFGGIYSDTDVICLNSFHDLVANDLTFFTGIELNNINQSRDPFYTSSGVMGAVKGSPIMKYSLDHYKTHREAPELLLNMRSGPGLVSRACQNELATTDNRESILILPCSYFYPLPYENKWISSEEILNFISSETLAVHLWDGSWVK